MSFAKKLNVPLETLRLREFIWNGVGMSVIVPSKREFDEINDRAKVLDQGLFKKHLDYLLAKYPGATLVDNGQYFMVEDDKQISLNKIAEDMALRDGHILLVVNLLVKSTPGEVFTIEDMDEDLSKNDQTDLMIKILRVIKGEDDPRKN